MTTSDPDDLVPTPVEPTFDDLILQVVEERLAVSKRRISRGTVVGSVNN